MNKRKLGKEGLEVSCIGLGCMGMSQAYGTPVDRVDGESIRVIHRALELGVNFFDTAEIYGPFTNEVLLGRALTSRRERAIIATKFGFDIQGEFPYKMCSRPEKIRAACDGSLKRLGVDYIDLLYQHRVDPQVPIEDVVGTVGELIDKGKVRYIGLSEAGPDTIRRAHKERRISVLQSEYSIWERGIEERILPTIRELGIGLVPFSPLGRGFLTGGIRSFDDIPQGDYRRTDPRYQGGHLAANRQIVASVEKVAKKHGATPAQVAIAWTLHQGEEVVPIPGTKRMRYLEENCAAATLVLSGADLEELNLLVHETQGERYGTAMMAQVER
jgi:aryl-alcohol dehydrogenase-like predicted oxidoreductase